MTVRTDAVAEESTAVHALPRHVAIIMDGNGRWAHSRGLARAEGHRRGVQTVRDIVRHAGRRGIAYLTLFSFSSENWNRPADEVADLLTLLRVFIRKDLIDLHRSGVRVRVVGGRENLPGDIGALLDEAESLTAANTAMTLVVAFNYGSRDEIARAARSLAAEVVAGRMRAEDIDETALARHLMTAEIPDPDLIIRTSGEQRLSNFLLWQAAYAEFVFVPVLWPDFREQDFDRALFEFQNRDRRYGGLSAKAGA
ncbi:isoprenyl transferase [Methylobrevis pamukkalensis]|uniref:Isoprenyl transferase n=1 Tax=Methylobrevis pamukkalensis TaxID=1439726 RepID=A0A1E3H4A8_9HYPH|nr:isoprenyl transferase [Methylobrevis pamukkalensis]ODN71144.1 Ditrans,polycis-undecaprenyl-diphosphate synthase ((2E,6E)-farnesyl-diphosphate specific) [Methylobrevis pamukkalensis]